MKSRTQRLSGKYREFNNFNRSFYKLLNVETFKNKGLHNFFNNLTVLLKKYMKSERIGSAYTWYVSYTPI